MSIILKGIDLPKEGEQHRIIVRHNGQVILCREVCYEKGEAIQIPKGHGRLIDMDELLSHLSKDPLFDLVERYGISGVIESRPTILEAEE